ncbi:MAG: ATP-binding cassette domain-containing protein, partial [Burkholderiaceae bacterium]
MTAAVGRPLLEVRGLTKRYLGLTAVNALSYQVEAGAIVGLIGPNGSGKSTSIDCISGFQHVDGGEWFLDGRPLAGQAPHRIALAGLTRTFQTVRAYDELSLLENLCVASQESDGEGWWQSLR